MNAPRRATRAMAANVKGGKSPKGVGAGGPGAGLGPAGERACKAIRRGRRHGVTVWFFCEFTKLQEEAIRKAFPNLMIFRATPNQRHPGGVEIGNAFVVDPAFWWPAQTHRELLLEGLGEVLHLPVLQLEPRGWGGHAGTVTFVGVHWWAGRRWSVRRARRRAARALEARVNGIGRVVLLGDFQIAIRLFKGWRGFRAGVDAVLVRGVRGRRGRRHEGFVGAVSDHPAVSLEVSW